MHSQTSIEVVKWAIFKDEESLMSQSWKCQENGKSSKAKLSTHILFLHFERDFYRSNEINNISLLFKSETNFNIEILG